ncbi:hypothetical protein WJX82_008972 [Trebouxia sp. C0006]
MAGPDRRPEVDGTSANLYIGTSLQLPRALLHLAALTEHGVTLMCKGGSSASSSKLHNNIAQKRVEQINRNAAIMRHMAASPHVPEVQVDYSTQQEVNYSMFRLPFGPVVRLRDFIDLRRDGDNYHAPPQEFLHMVTFKLLKLLEALHSKEHYLGVLLPEHFLILPDLTLTDSSAGDLDPDEADVRVPSRICESVDDRMWSGASLDSCGTSAGDVFSAGMLMYELITGHLPGVTRLCEDVIPIMAKAIGPEATPAHKRRKALGRLFKRARQTDEPGVVESTCQRPMAKALLGISAVQLPADLSRAAEHPGTLSAAEEQQDFQRAARACSLIAPVPCGSNCPLRKGQADCECHRQSPGKSVISIGRLAKVLCARKMGKAAKATSERSEIDSQDALEDAMLYREFALMSRQRLTTEPKIDSLYDVILPAMGKACMVIKSIWERSVLIPRGWNNTYIQREDFTIRLQHIIGGYGGGGTALKEMVGNSDDAKAAEFVVFIDGCQYSRPGPPWQNMATWQGPALLVWNSATFTRQDWINLTAKVFITLPLPLEKTGLPVHINGAFKVHSDRRNLWSGDDDGGKGAQNIAILEDEIAPTWAAAVAALTSHPDCVGLEQLMYLLWPTAVKLSPAQLQPVAVSTVRCFIDQGYAVFWVPGVTSAYGGGEWVKASQACFLPIDDEAATPLVADVARRAALKIPHLPKHALEALLEAVKVGDTHIRMLTPAVLRKQEDQMGAEKLFIACNKRSSELLELMCFDKAILLEPSAAWEKLARAKTSSGALILESGLLNAQAPTVADMAAALPAAWQGDMCKYSLELAGTFAYDLGVELLGLSEEPFICALEAAARFQRVPLRQLVCPEKLGQPAFSDLRRALATNLPAPPNPPQPSNAIWQILSRMGAASARFAAIEFFTPIRFHSASPTHQTLVNHACLQTPELSEFLNSAILPSLQAAEQYNGNHEALLLHALDDLANDPDYAPTTPTCLPIDGVLQSVSSLVDSSSWLFRTLFSSQHPHPEYHLLPAQYATVQRLSVLKKVQLAHEESPDPNFFLACSAWSTVRYTLAGLLIFPPADLPPPYNAYAWQWRPFCSLLESEDHEHYRLVSTAAPVISNSVLGTQYLRRKLGLPPDASVLRVIDHLVNMASSEAAGCLRQTGAATQGLRQQLLADFQNGYRIIVGAASLLLTQPADRATLNSMSQRLASSQWLLVSGGFFVSPQSVYFGLQQDTGGAFTVPPTLLQPLQNYPAVRRWLVSAVGMHDLSGGHCQPHSGNLWSRRSETSLPWLLKGTSRVLKDAVRRSLQFTELC